MMRVKETVLLWLLRRHRPAYARLNGLRGLEISSDTRFLDIHAELIRDNRGIQSLNERYNLYRLALATERLPGAMAEAGVYRGGSAKLLCRIKGDCPLYLFDTFEGMPEVGAGADGVFRKGDFGDTCRDEVSAYLAEYPNIHIVKGLFPDSARGLEPERLVYRFVHLDLDIHESTLRALEFFYPRMARGGVLVSHDYSRITAPGVRRAFDQFFGGRPETVIPLWQTQCAVVKM